jgi:hypothetical protein
MRHALISLLAVIAVTMVFAVRASAGTEEIAAQLDQSFRADYAYPIENRRRIFFLIVQYWDEFDRKVPRVTPEEHTWWDAELRSGNEARVIGANNTRIGGLESLRFDISGCRDTLKSFRDGAFIGEVNTKLPTHSAEGEAFQWLMITEYCFLHDDFIRMHLAKSGLTESTMTTTQADAWLSHLLGEPFRPPAESR